MRSKPQVVDNNEIEEHANKPADFFSKENPKIGNTAGRFVSDVIQKNALGILYKVKKFWKIGENLLSKNPTS